MEAENNSLFYKGASLSFIASDVIPALSGDIVNYAKLRVGYGESAGFANPYRTRSLLSLNAKAFDPGSGVIQSNTTSNTLGNEALEPELLSEVENIGKDEDTKILGLYPIIADKMDSLYVVYYYSSFESMGDIIDRIGMSEAFQNVVNKANEIGKLKASNVIRMF